MTIRYSLLFGIREYSSIRDYSWTIRDYFKYSWLFQVFVSIREKYSWLFGIRYYSEFELRTPNTWKFEHSNLDNVDLDTVDLDTVDLDTVNLRSTKFELRIVTNTE